ncbi:MAG: hypothetical protein Q7T48_03630 [Cellvibrio sp.]|uniref:hypothetical protein n=1 Tax=Cellvibrio sp. TaxID=1965322 RepID=UPI0027239BC7|nr:hypothetical protein [Cellvibrio sp.]
MEKLPDTFTNPALLAKAGLQLAKVKLTCERGKTRSLQSAIKKAAAMVARLCLFHDPKKIRKLIVFTILITKTQLILEKQIFLGFLKNLKR